MRMRRRIPVVLLVVITFGVMSPAFCIEEEQRVAPLPVVWSSLGPGGVIVARVVTAETTCPDIILDSGMRPMQMRAQASPPDYPVLVCEANIPPDAASASVAGQPLPLPTSHPRRIVVMGDTGCRVKATSVQACNDPRAWPFSQIARSAAAWRPDLVIHVGDLLYREVACPAGNAGCAGSPWGDNWAAITADFFTPATSLLRVAPWVFVRGNHEECSRNGAAWFRLFDPRPMPTACQDYTTPYAVPAGDVRLLLLDSAYAGHLKKEQNRVARYAAQFALLRDLAQENSWLLSHSPLWALGRAGDKGGREQIFRENRILQTASQNTLPANVKLVLSGHIHLFELLSFTDGRPLQLVTGNGGTILDHTVTTPLVGLAIAGATVATGTVIAQFGYLTLEQTAGEWIATPRNSEGVPQAVCSLGEKRVQCVAP